MPLNNKNDLKALYTQVATKPVSTPKKPLVKDQATIDCERLINDLGNHFKNTAKSDIKTVKFDLLSNTIMVEYKNGKNTDLLKTLQEANFNTIQSDVKMLDEAWRKLTKTLPESAQIFDKLEEKDDYTAEEHSTLLEILRYIAAPNSSKISKLDPIQDEDSSPIGALIYYKDGKKSFYLASNNKENIGLTEIQLHNNKMDISSTQFYGAKTRLLQEILLIALKQESQVSFISQNGKDHFVFENSIMNFEYKFTEDQVIFTQTPKNGAISPQEAKAIWDYTDHSYGDIWKSMGVEISEVNAHTSSTLDSINNIIQAMYISSGIRKLESQADKSSEAQYVIMGEFPQNYEQYKSHLNDGTPIDIKTFSSTTTIYDVASEFTHPEKPLYIIFKNPKGADISNLSNLPSEKEFLVMPGQFAVTGELVDEDGATYFTVEQL